MAAWLCATLLAAFDASAALIRSADGQTVYDTILHVRWLANANLAATNHFGVANIAPDGAMDYATAQAWVAAMNAAHYLGYANWQLPATPTIDATCRATGPNGNSFGYGCSASAMASLYYQSFGDQYPNTAVAIPSSPTGPFTNIQPYLYWSSDAPPDAKQGWHTFSFNTGFHGANVDNHYMYVLPMIKGKLAGAPATNGNGLQVSADKQTVYDPMTNVTWLANADLAATQTFAAQCTNRDGTLCINPDGSMSHTTALAWIGAMNAAHYLGQTAWQLPPIPDVDPSCTLSNDGFDCTGNPMGALYYNQLGLGIGAGVVTQNVATAAFTDVQPYLYWTCQAATGSQVLCSGESPAPDFAWSFSFGNGFTGTDIVKNKLYVMVYSPEPPANHHRAARH